MKILCLFVFLYKTETANLSTPASSASIRFLLALTGDIKYTENYESCCGKHTFLKL